MVLSKLKAIIDGLNLIEPDNLDVTNLINFLKLFGENEISTDYLEKTIDAFSIVYKYTSKLEEKGGIIENLWILSEELKDGAKNEDCFKDDFNKLRSDWIKYRSNFQEFTQTGYRIISNDLHPITDYDKIKERFKSKIQDVENIEYGLNQLIKKIKKCKKE